MPGPMSSLLGLLGRRSASPPRPPHPPRLLSAGPAALALEWDEAGCTGSPRLRVAAPGCVLVGLEPETEYDVRVLAHLPDGDTPDGDGGDGEEGLREGDVVYAAVAGPRGADPVASAALWQPPLHQVWRLGCVTFGAPVAVAAAAPRAVSRGAVFRHIVHLRDPVPRFPLAPLPWRAAVAAAAAAGAAAGGDGGPLHGLMAELAAVLQPPPPPASCAAPSAAYARAAAWCPIGALCA
eukprot:gene53384-35910_t